MAHTGDAIEGVVIPDVQLLEVTTSYPSRNTGHTKFFLYKNAGQPFHCTNSIILIFHLLKGKRLLLDH